jgi:hypothetical protein
VIIGSEIVAPSLGNVLGVVSDELQIASRILAFPPPRMELRP